jgi:hypothetical protein
VLRELDGRPEDEFEDDAAEHDAAHAGFVTVAWPLTEGTRVRARTVRVRTVGGALGHDGPGGGRQG